MNALTLSNTHSLKRELHQRILRLSYLAFLHLVAQLLASLGYQEVTLAGRTAFKGRSHNGGVDLVAFLPGPLGGRRIVIQAKQFPAERLLFQRAVDELRGACLRAGAAEAVLVTTSGFSPSIRPASTASSLAAIRLMDGDRLLEQLIIAQLGVATAGTGALRLDEGFFQTLEELYPQQRKVAIAQVTVRFSLVNVSKRKKTAALPQRS